MENVNELDYAFGLYPLSTRNKEKLLGCEIVDQVEDKTFKAKVLIFQDKYRRLRIDLFIMPTGALYLSDYYGDTVNRNEMVFVKLGGNR